MFLIFLILSVTMLAIQLVSTVLTLRDMKRFERRYWDGRK